MDSSALTVVAILTVRPSALAEFRAYESHAARIMAKHGGKIERVVLVPPEAPDAPLREVHLVAFPGAAAFRAYRADPELAALADQRARSILDTELLIGHDVQSY